MTDARQRWRGLNALLRAAVAGGSRAVERIQIASARRVFVVLEAIPPLAAPARAVHVVHDASIATVHGALRVVTGVVGGVVDGALVQKPIPTDRSTRPRCSPPLSAVSGRGGGAAPCGS